jgi:hypothetical protein
MQQCLEEQSIYERLGFQVWVGDESYLMTRDSKR